MTVRTVLAAVVGAIVAFAVTFGVEAVGRVLYPPPPGIDFTNAEALRAYIHDLPVGAFLIVLAAWALATFAGAFVATKIGGEGGLRLAAVVGTIVMIASIANFVSIPHPLWFMVIAIFEIPICAYLAGRAAVRTR